MIIENVLGEVSMRILESLSSMGSVKENAEVSTVVPAQQAKKKSLQYV